MIDIVASTSVPTPVRQLITDTNADILAFAVEAFAQGEVAIATLVDIRGGAARALGSHVVVAADGRFCGYVSGGCVEAAVAAEALLALGEGRDRTVMFGDGSPFIDIVLPCGGGITVLIHILREITSITAVLDSLKKRRAVGLRYVATTQLLYPVEPSLVGWVDGDFVTTYQPVTRLIISGDTVEALTTARLAEVLGYDVRMTGTATHGQLTRDIDAFTAVILLHHDLDQEQNILNIAVGSAAFYIGALGSRRTHTLRIDRLKDKGLNECELSRIKAPIGIFGPTRDASSLALSVLADVAASRLTIHA